MALPLPLELEDLSDLGAEDRNSEDGGPLESGTRRAAKPDSSPVSGEEEHPRHDSQRPTFRVPSAAGFAAFLGGAPVALATDQPSLASLTTLSADVEPSRIPESPPPPEAVAMPQARRTTVLPKAPDPEPITHADADEAIVPARSGNTLRVRLTPYAREHAVADGDADDTPGAMLLYLKLLGSFERVPYVNASMHQVMMAKLDHREGFVLSLVDGKSDIDSILDACPMPTHKTLRILHGLRERGILALR